jgi:hypothetical protein
MNLPKSIKSSQLMREASYANAVLQAFIQLECVQEWVKNLYKNGALNLTYYNTSLTKDLIFLFCSLSNGMNLDSSKIILDFDAKSRDIWKKDIGKDPYHFLYYFLEILHYENNMPKNPCFNIALYNQMVRICINSDNAVFNQFNNYISQTQNSFASNNFFNIQKFMLHCPNCNYMFTYGLKKIIKFNYDEILIQRNQSNPLKFGQKLELSECFHLSLLAQKTKCLLCNNNFSCESQKIYSSANVLIIAINRSGHSQNFRNDLNFYLNIDITQYIINTNSENRKYKLKSVISCYDYNKYLADIFINGNYYRLVDWKNGIDVKLLKNVNQLMEYEPCLLIYEVDYQGQLFEKMKLMQQIDTFYKMSQFMKMMQQNINFANVNQGFNQMNINDTGKTGLGFNLKFLVIPQNWNGDTNIAFPITPQVTPDYTLKDTIDKFYSKLIKPREAIIKFTLNNTNLDVNSTQTLRQLNINENSVIHALKSPNFDALKLEGQ